VLADSRLREAVRAAVALAREDFEGQTQELIAENDAKWERHLGQLEQRHIAASLIEGAKFKGGGDHRRAQGGVPRRLLPR